MVTIGGLLFTLLMGVLGFWRGALRMLLSLVALLVAGLLASPLSAIGSVLLKATGLVPRSLLGVAGLLATGILIFGLFMIPIEIKLRQREKALKEQEVRPDAQWDRFWGAILGGVWGFLLTGLVLTGVAVIGQTQHAMRMANAEIDYRAERRHVETMRIQRIAQASHVKPQPIPLQIDLEEVDDSKMKVDEPSSLEKFSSEIDASLFSGLVHKVEPMDLKSEKMLRDLSVTVGDPLLFARFQDHPDVQRLSSEPRLQALSKDPEISAAIREGRYRDLLDNEKLAEVASDHELAAKLKALNLQQLLKDIKTAEYAPLLKSMHP